MGKGWEGGRGRERVDWGWVGRGCSLGQNLQLHVKPEGCLVKCVVKRRNLRHGP